MLHQLQERLEVLIRKYNQLKESEQALQEKCASLEQELREKNSRITALEEELLIKKLGENSDNEALKKYIDGIIAEIENTISNL